MSGYSIILLKNMLEELGEDKAKKVLSQFSCPLNKDVEYFLHNKAIEFAKQSISVTYLVFSSYKNKPVIVGYFTLTNKSIIVSNHSGLSKSLRKRINKFGIYDPDNKGYRISAPLIAQLA